MSIQLTHSAEDEAPFTREEINHYFQKAVVDRRKRRVGAEFEKIAVCRKCGVQLPYAGRVGIRSILERLSEKFHWKPFFEGEHLVALRRGQSTISFEPGGQLELASAPSSHLSEIAEELHTHREELRQVVDPETIAWLSIGVSPFVSADHIRLVPRGRYYVMADYLGQKSSHAHHMMRTTASTQASFDYTSEEDAVRKFLVAITLAPIANALVGNSPLYQGRPTGYVSFRGRIWEGMDPDRSGLLASVARPEAFSFKHWTDYLLDRPMMFYAIRNVYTPAHGRPFRDFLDHGHEGYFPTRADWEVHLTSVFPEARLKTYLEVRGADSTSPEMALGLVALWKGILYDDDSLLEASRLQAAISPEQRLTLYREAYARGLAGTFSGRSLKDLASELLRLADDGLRRQSEESLLPDERPLLEPLKEIAASGKSPGMRLLERWPSICHCPNEVVKYIAY